MSGTIPALQFGRAPAGATCSDCGFFSEGKSSGICHFTGEKVKGDDKAGDCAGWHAGDWLELWKADK